MGLLTVSLAAVFLPHEGGLDTEGLSDLFADLKREAKSSRSRTALRVVGDPPDSKPVPVAFRRPGIARGGMESAEPARAEDLQRKSHEVSSPRGLTIS